LTWCLTATPRRKLEGSGAFSLLMATDLMLL
jgi:hypothetical protein